MSYPINKLELLIELCDRQIELLTGGNQPQISNNNFAKKNENTTETTRTTPLGKVYQTNTDFSDINSGAQSMLSSNFAKVAPLEFVNNLLPQSPMPVNSPLAMLGESLKR
ncbi:CTB family bacteriocin [Anabaena sp. UHCC 0451]|uniref:CTB family bacteriocin n=1 Tax=Anabaena sp. UHCC 0451 TaxID=2055235 RepID=UPI002B20CE09|nr:CTB family bacteriocin [Anabaena sp. UHCC 0451]MEA5579364.1 CTB family bacteriocin [Anabaena sp. UHCC 0451]